MSDKQRIDISDRIRIMDMAIRTCGADNILLDDIIKSYNKLINAMGGKTDQD